MPYNENMLIRVLLLLSLACVSLSHAFARRGSLSSQATSPAIKGQRASAFDVLFPGLAAVGSNSYSAATEDTETSRHWKGRIHQLQGRNLLYSARDEREISTTNEQAAYKKNGASGKEGPYHSAVDKLGTEQVPHNVYGRSATSSATRAAEKSSDDDEDDKMRVLALQMELKSKAESLQHFKQKQKYLEKSLALKTSQAQSRRGEVELNEDVLQTSARMLNSSKQEASDISEQYHALLARTAEMQRKKTGLVEKLAALINSKREFEIKLQDLTLEEIVEKHTAGLPGSMAGALRKSADVLTPFFDTLVVAAETNERLVDHVGSEIDKYTHVNIRQSPFLHGLLFYAVLMIPAMTIATFLRRLIDTSSKLTVSHVVILGNVYFLVLCVLCTIEGALRRREPAANLYKKHERFFVAFNLILALYYMWHVCVLALQAIYTRRRRDWAQVLSTTCIGIHYYLFTWQRVFTNSSPRMIVANYVVYATIFSFIIYERAHRINAPWILENKFFRLLKQNIPEATWLPSLPKFDFLVLISHMQASAHRLRTLYHGTHVRKTARRTLPRPPSFSRDDDDDTDSELELRSCNVSDDARQDRSPRRRRFMKSDAPAKSKPGLAALLFGGKAAARPAGSSDSDDDMSSDDSSSEEEQPTAYFTSLSNMWRAGRDRLWSGWQSSAQHTSQYKYSNMKDSRRDRIGRSDSGRVSKRK